MLMVNKKYHHLVIATHSDQVKSVLNLNDMEKKIFSKIIYKKMLSIFIVMILFQKM